MTEGVSPPTPALEPLFKIDLAENGGLFAPISLEEARSWIQREQGFWSWIQSGQFGNQDQGVKQSFELLNQCINNLNQAQQYQASNPQEFQNQIQAIQRQLRDAFVDRKLPHSSTPQAKRIDEYRRATDDQSGNFFASVFVPPPQGHHYQPQNLTAWRGMMEGLVDRFNLVNAPLKGRKLAADQSFEQLRNKAETLVNEKTLAYDELHRNYDGVAKDIAASANSQATNFSSAQEQRESDFQKLVAEHKDEMEKLRKTFREEIALRAPAEYWEAKRVGHERMTRIFGGISFGSIAASAIVLGYFIHDLLGKTPQGQVPESWKVAMLVLIALFTVWGVRLLVRMFLSHLHLSTDAAERVVMVKTYLSLLEGDHLSGNEDRQLILQALFRPASDGIVKDEGLPPSAFEFLTRQSKS